MKIKIMQPDYYKEFKCIGADCRNSCCTGKWKIHVDKNTYKKYRNLSKNNPFYNELKNNVILCERDNFQKYAEYRCVDENATGKSGCVFQTKEGWCKIHSELGEEYLGSTCREYPRVSSYTEFKDSSLNFIERACNISCEEVANIFIKKQDYIEYEILEQEHSKNYINENLLSRLNNVLHEDKREIIKYYPDIKSIVIAILQNRDYCFEDRLILFALFCEKLDKIEKNNSIDEIPKFINEFVLAVDNRYYDEILNMEINSELSYAFSFVILEVFLDQLKLSEDKTFSKIHENIKSLNIKTIDDYKRSKLSKSFNQILKEKEIFIEHIFVDEVFKRVIPFYKDYDIFENAQLILSIYVLYRLMVSGVLGDKDDISDEDLVDVTAYFGKMLLHSDLIYQLLIGTIKVTEIDSLANLIVLIKG